MRGICLGMRKFTERYKLSALSLQELRRGMQAVTTRLADLGIEFDGHVVAQANVINAFSLWCLKLPHCPRNASRAKGPQGQPEAAANRAISFAGCRTEERLRSRPSRC